MSSSSKTASTTFTSREVPRAPVPREAHDVAALYQRWLRQVRRWLGRLGGAGIDVARIVPLTVHDHRRAWRHESALRSREVVSDELVSRAR
jgi:hypothetical protein